MRYKFIDQNDSLYRKAVELRIASFFKGMDNVEELINDSNEAQSIHLVCLNNLNEVIATGRLNRKGEFGILSQMAVDKRCQQKGIGKELMNRLIEKCEELNILNLTLRARETAFGFYEKFDFEKVGELYPSEKTGIIHQKMNRIRMK